MACIIYIVVLIQTSTSGCMTDILHVCVCLKIFHIIKVHTSFFCGVCVAKSLVFCAMFSRSLFIFLSFFCLSHCIVCQSSIYGFRLPLWYLQTFLKFHSLHNDIGINTMSVGVVCYFVIFVYLPWLWLLIVSSCSMSFFITFILMSLLNLCYIIYNSI